MAFAPTMAARPASRQLVLGTLVVAALALGLAGTALVAMVSSSSAESSLARSTRLAAPSSDTFLGYFRPKDALGSCPPMSVPSLNEVTCSALEPIAKPPGPKFEPTPRSSWSPASTADCQSIIAACNADRLASGGGASGLYPIDPTSGVFEPSQGSCDSYSCELPPNPPIGDLAILCDSTDDEIRSSSQTLQGTYPLLAACASEAASEFQRLPYPPFWSSLTSITSGITAGKPAPGGASTVIPEGRLTSPCARATVYITSGRATAPAPRPSSAKPPTCGS
jgi:hypothetical protein